MGKLVLSDGTVLTTTPKQQDIIMKQIMFRDDYEKVEFMLEGRKFKLGDVLSDPEEIARVTQTTLLDIPVDKVKQKGY